YCTCRGCSHWEALPQRSCSGNRKSRRTFWGWVATWWPPGPLGLVLLCTVHIWTCANTHTHRTHTQKDTHKHTRMDTHVNTYTQIHTNKQIDFTLISFTLSLMP